MNRIVPADSLNKLVAFPAVKPVETTASIVLPITVPVEKLIAVVVNLEAVEDLTLKLPAELTVIPVGATRAVTGKITGISAAVDE